MVTPAVDLAFHTWEGLRLWVVPPEYDLIRETRVCSVTERSGGLLLVLEGVTDRTTAQRLQGRHLLARVADCVSADRGAGGDRASSDNAGDTGGTSTTGATGGAAPGTKDADVYGQEASAVGVEVTEEAYGYLGTVVEERRGVAQTLWVVEGPLGEVLIPAVDEFICSRDGQAARVRLPNGLVELNA